VEACEQNDADENERAAHREGRVEVLRELGIDCERKRLRHLLQTAREHDRGAELAESAGEREREAGDETAAREWEDDPEEGPGGSGAECAGRGGKVGIRGLERGNRLADVQRARDVGDREDDGRLRSEADMQTQEIECPAGGNTRGSSTRVTASEWPGKLRPAGTKAAGVPKATISSCADRLVFRLTTNASRTTGFES